MLTPLLPLREPPGCGLCILQNAQKLQHSLLYASCWAFCPGVMEREGPEALAHSSSFYSSPICKEPPAAQLPPGPAAAVVAFPVCDSGITDGKGVLGQFVHALDRAEVVLFCTANLSASCLGPSDRPARRGCPPGDGRPPCSARPPPPASHPSDGGTWGGPRPFSSPFPCQGHNFGLHNFSSALLLSAQTAPMLAPLAPQLTTQAALGCELSPAAKATAGSSTSQGTAQQQGSSLCPP